LNFPRRPIGLPPFPATIRLDNWSSPAIRNPSKTPEIFCLMGETIKDASDVFTKIKRLIHYQ
jgi:hypothetical protein